MRNNTRIINITRLTRIKEMEEKIMENSFKTKMLSVILCLCMVMGFAPMTAFAQSDDAFVSETHDVFSKTTSTIAPGVSHSINYAYAKKDGKQMVYYVAVADINRDDVEVHSSYKDAQCTNFGMDKLTNQMSAANAKYTNPEYANYNPYFEAVAGVNGDFYNMQTGRPSGAFVMDGVMSSSKANNRPFFAIMEDGTALCGANNSQWDAAVAKHGKVMEAVGGSQMLVVDGKDVTASATGSYNTDRHSRTMVGVTADGKVVMTVLDGRQEPFSCGGTMHELAQIMLEQGCVSAINLDGGGSTTFAARPEGQSDVKVINRPSDGSERSISSGLLIASTAVPSDKFDHAVIKAENEYVTPGSEVNISAVGVSPAGTSAQIPENVTYSATLGTVENGKFVSDGTTGDAKVQMFLDGKVVGETAIHVVIPDKLTFDSETITVPFGKTVGLSMTATYGLNKVVIKPSDVRLALAENSIGTVDGFNFTAAEESSVTSSNITATLVSNNEITAVSTINLGKGSVTLWDFEDKDVSDFKRASSSNYNYILTPGTCSIATAEDGKVHSGKYSMRVTSDFSVSTESGYMNARLCFNNSNYIDLKGATRVGMWVYIPDEAASLNGRIFIKQVTERNEDGSIKSIASTTTTATQIDNGGNWNVGFNTQYDESGWHYIYADLPAGKDWCLYNTLLDYYINDRDNTQYNYNHLDYKSLNQNIILYIDDITVDYSSAVDDREAPIFSSVRYADTTMSDAVELKGQTVTNNVLSFGAVVHENTEKSNYTGLDESTAKAYIDGVEMPCTIAGGIISIADRKLADGLHKIKFSICDKQGNYASVIRKINVQANSNISTVKLVPHDASLDKILLGSVYYADLVATDIEKVQSVSVDLDLNNISIWELDHMEVAKGFEATYSIESDDKVATINIERTGKNNETGEKVLVSMPIRTWELPAVKADYGHAGKVWMYPDYKKGNETWPIDISVKVDRGFVEFVDGTTDVFSGDDVQVDTESYVWDNATKPAEYATWNGGHDHRVEMAKYYAAGATNVAVPVAIPDKTATCTESGYAGRTYCEVCKSVVDWGTKIPATGHSYEIIENVLKCKDCGELYNGEYEGKYYTDGVLANGWSEEFYYADGVKVTGIQLIDGSYYNFGEDGVSQGKYTGLIKDEKGTMYSANGQLRIGWQVVGNDNYYFGSKHYALTGKVKLGEPLMEYTFDENGILISGSWKQDEKGVKYYWAGKAVKHKFFEIEGKTYFFDLDTYAVKGIQKIALSHGDEPVYYWFDENTCEMRATFEGNGLKIYGENDHIVYLKDGVPQYAGLVADDRGDYYYINSTLEAVKNCSYGVSEVKSNGLLPAGIYEFGADGKMIVPRAKNGVVQDEDGEIRYYVDDVAQYAGLVQDSEGNYYYINSTKKAVKNCKYGIGESRTNGLLPAGIYEFGADGKMIVPEVKNGVVLDEDGEIRYYVNDVAQYAGLVQDSEGNYYYINSAKKAVKNCKYGIGESRTNGLLPAGIYEFGADGKMIVPEVKNGVVLDEDGEIRYYVNDAAQYAGLVQDSEGNYYYINSAKKAVKNCKYGIGATRTNGLLPAGIYEFGADGKMLNPPV